MAASVKIERLKQVIRFKVTQVLQRDISDPRIGILTITKIDLKRDISECTVFYSVLGEDSERSKCQHALNDCCGFIQSQVAGALKTRVTPRLKFEFDPSVAGSIRIAEMLRLDREKNEPTDEVDDSCVLPDDPATD